MEPVVYLITGPMAAGKTTVARLLAARFPHGVHLEGDLFRRSIVSGREEVTPELRPQAMEQLRLRYRLAAAAADTYAEAGFTVALEDVVAGPLLGDYRATIRTRPCHVVVLLPSAGALAAREARREAKGYGAWTVEELRDGFASSTPRVGIWLDTTAMTPDETVDRILAQTTTERSPIVIADYDPGWPALFERLAGPVRRAVADLGARVEHVGSTSVPGLAAKPVIDMDVVVRAPADAPEAIEPGPRGVSVAARHPGAPPLRRRGATPPASATSRGGTAWTAPPTPRGSPDSSPSSCAPRTRQKGSDPFWRVGRLRLG